MPSDDVGPNEVGYQDRLNFVHRLFKDQLKLTPRQVKTIAYEEGFPFPYNNFVFVVETDTKITADNYHGKQSGTEHIPLGCSKFVLRLPNTASTYNGRVRVENEVAALSLARDALKDRLPDIVPQVYAWGSAAGGEQGWMLQEFMSGQSVLETFPKMSMDEQKVVLEQLADVLQCLQQYEIPSSVHGYGGLTFNDAGDIVAGPMSIMDCGPFQTYPDLVIGTIYDKLVRADKNPRIEGWQKNGIRARLDQFLEVGIKSMLVAFQERQPKLVHADLSIDNLLYDPVTMRLTAVLDFDFGHIGTVADDFFRSLGHGIGRFPDPRDGDETRPLNEAMLHEFPSPLPAPTDHIDWSAAKVWDDALRKRRMFRPGNISGIEILSQLFWLSSQILPFKLSWDIVAKNSGPDKVREWKELGEDLLDKFLKDHGF